VWCHDIGQRHGHTAARTGSRRCDRAATAVGRGSGRGAPGGGPLVAAAPRAAPPCTGARDRTRRCPQGLPPRPALRRPLRAGRHDARRAGDPVSELGIECRGRLVGDQQRRLVGGRCDDARPLQHPAAPRVRPLPNGTIGAAAAAAADAAAAETLDHMAGQWATPQRTPRLGNVAPDRHQRVERAVGILCDESHGAPTEAAQIPRRSTDHLVTPDQDRAGDLGSRRQEPQYGSGDGRLPAPGLADDPEAATRLHLERQPPHRPRAVGVGDVEVADLQRRRQPPASSVYSRIGRWHGAIIMRVIPISLCPESIAASVSASATRPGPVVTADADGLGRAARRH
jgi:hypothetical protein